MENIRSLWVVNYEPGQDIQVLAGDLDLATLKPRMPRAYERFLGATYFNRKSARFAEEGDEALAIWYFRAALAHFQGILDLVRTDLPSSCGQLWERSDISRNLCSHPLVYTMTRVRNIALHTGKLDCSMEKRNVTFIPGGMRGVVMLVIDGISFNHFDRHDQVASDVIEWFNRQATTWSANALLTESAFILMAALDNFVRINLEHIPEQESALRGIECAERALSYA